MEEAEMASRDRLLDLMAARATEGLAAAESDELEQGLQAQRELAADDLDLAAAAVYLALDATTATDPMPDRLKERILGQAIGNR
jgi:hypothetical protein